MGTDDHSTASGLPGWPRKALRRLGLGNFLKIVAIAIAVPAALVAIQQLRDDSTLEKTLQVPTALSTESSEQPYHAQSPLDLETPEQSPNNGPNSEDKSKPTPLGPNESPDGQATALEAKDLKVARAGELASDPQGSPNRENPPQAGRSELETDPVGPAEQAAIASVATGFAIAPERKEEERDRIAARALQAQFEQIAASAGILNSTLALDFSETKLFEDATAGRVSPLNDAGVFSTVERLVVGTVSTRCTPNPVQDPMLTCRLVFQGLNLTKEGREGASLLLRASGVGFDSAQAIESAAERLARTNNWEWLQNETPN